MVLQPIRESTDLPNAVPLRNHRQNRFIERTTDDLDATGLDQLGDTTEILRVVRLQPLHQWSARVQRNPQMIVRLENFKERQVAVLIGRFKNVVEVTNRLVVVQDQTELNRRMTHGNKLENRW